MCYARKIVGFRWDVDLQKDTEKELGEEFDGQFHCARFNCKGCNHRLVDGQLEKRNQGFRINLNFQKKTLFRQDKNSLNRFPFKFEEQLGSGGFATVYKGLFHGVESAFKVIPLKKEEHKYNIKSYGCHEYYNQEND